MINKDIIIRGGYGFGNFGDDALMYTIVTELKEVSKDIALLCKKETYIKRILPDTEVIDYEKLQKPIYSKLLVYGGGTQFYHFKKNKFNKGLKDKLFNLNHIIKFIEKRILKNRYIENKFQIKDYASNVALVGVGVGPFEIEDSVVEQNTAKLFLQSSFVGVRDNFALNKSKEWGVKQPLLSPDICYSFKSNFLNSYTNTSTKINKIGIIVRDWNYANGGGEYYDKLIKVSKDLKEKGFEVKFILFDTKSDPYWLNKKDELDMIIWNPLVDTFDGFLEKISIFDLFITARFHGAIFASILQTPFITIEVEQKLKFISEVYNDSSACWERPFEISDLMNQIDLINKDYNSKKAKTILKMNELKKLSDEMFIELKNYYKSLK
ncbi:polysaccharide pyruvyl transferase family protein [Empedobacter brevis]|uniref:Polysaccharide pyruvyl transferase family protein n=1 Tax=Empedobacter brevis TaxID=247 RepID=A0AAJ1QFY3_9FLAO|nr:polysaccharide pyruvyl transferase family protein [Empedobacter brevis]MDM1073323.1 polysaccharide pyruvyl transferase family protein [Empedobacter brevis]